MGAERVMGNRGRVNDWSSAWRRRKCAEYKATAVGGGASKLMVAP